MRVWAVGLTKPKLFVLAASYHSRLHQTIKAKRNTNIYPQQHDTIPPLALSATSNLNVCRFFETVANMSLADDNFRRELMAMSRPILNTLNMANYTRKQRRLIDEERCRRRNTGPEPTPTTNNSIDQLLQHLVLSDPVVSEPQPPPANINPNPGHSNRKTPGRAKGSPKKYHLFEKYHDRVCQEVDDVTFHPIDQDGIGRGDTSLCGAFVCSNNSCRKRWTSGLIHVEIRRYPNVAGKLSYNARVYNQRCKRCKKLGTMELDVEIYVERVARRIKMWRGEFIPDMDEKFKKSTGPHEAELCEGCKAGRCEQGKQLDLDGAILSTGIPDR
ncbi:hypothetical protein TWF694_007248 [Orbilia ellipsospora]|uniref:3CxxC-type domain-containing protein n=1 Tax=Orbilia ellipsospora TaxID=2528407 RepID=A0AAV9XIL3_9PEZI